MTKRYAMAALTICILSSTAMAGEMNFLGMGRHQTSKIYYDPCPFDGRNVAVGEIRMNVDGEEMIAYCADAGGRANGPAYAIERLTPSEFAGDRGERAAWLYATYADTITSKLEAAGLQAAIWEVLHETADTYSLFNGSERGGYFSLGKETISNKAMDYLGTLTSYAPVSGVTFLKSTDDSRQSMIVPEPAMLGFMIPGAVLFMLRRK